MEGWMNDFLYEVSIFCQEIAIGLGSFPYVEVSTMGLALNRKCKDIPILDPNN